MYDAAAARAALLLRSGDRGGDCSPGPIRGAWCIPICGGATATEPIAYPNERIEAVSGQTLGVPLFQEQAMRLVMVAAGFTPARPTSSAGRWPPGSARGT